VIEVSPENEEAFEAMVQEHTILACQKIGTTGGNEFKVNDVTCSFDTLNDIYFNTFKRKIEIDI